MTRPLRAGDSGPEFQGADTSGRVWRSGALRDRWVVIFFYPRDFSPVCTAQACAFRDVEDRLVELGAAVLAVSRDTPAEHRRFAARHALRYPLLSDADGSLAGAFGVRRRMLGLAPGRETFVIDPSWRVAMVCRSMLRGPDHARRVVRFLESQTGGPGAGGGAPVPSRP
ncbi:MAG: peroxiredoxin [Phycisphaerales bacterium]|nr:peroxiredoxin [Phycisphaerales bacterium]